MLKNSSELGVCEKEGGRGCYFDSIEVLAKHHDNYMLAEIAKAIEKQWKLIQVEAEIAKAIEKQWKLIQVEETKRWQEALNSAASSGVDSNAAKLDSFLFSY